MNAGSSQIEGIGTELKAEKNNPAGVRMQLNALASDSLAPGAQAVQQVMMECMQPYGDMPILTLTFTVGGAKSEYDLKIPAALIHFMEPTPMEGDDFMSRWQKLSTPALQNQNVVNGKVATIPAFVEQVLLQVRSSVQGAKEIAPQLCF